MYDGDNNDNFVDDFDNPYAGEPQRRQYSSARYAQKTSALAVLSLFAGILSFPFMCLCFLSFPFSISAIVCGHASRSICRSSRGEYSGIEIATTGMVMGYVSLLITCSFIGYAWLASPAPVPMPVPVPSTVPADPQVSETAVLMKQAENQLYSSSSPASGISTTEGDAQALAQHFIETLNVLDRTHFSETDADATEALGPRDYRVFAQLNEDSVAFLISVPGLDRFTPEARQILEERTWLIAQRTVDDVLPTNSRLAVAVYSAGEPAYLQMGVTTRDDSLNAGLETESASLSSLTDFFRLDKRPVTERLPESDSIDSEIDVGNRRIPAEAE